MAKHITATIDGIHGTIKILIEDDQDKHILELKWCDFSEEPELESKTGFLTSFISTPILVTEIAAEQFLRILIASLIRSFSIEPGGLKIINHIGDELSDIEFMPPTFNGGENHISDFVLAQDIVKRFWSIYEETNLLNNECIEACQAEGILEDFLSLLQIKTSGLLFALQKPISKEK